VGGHDRFADVQPEPAALEPARALGAVEALEHARQLVGVQPDAVVAHADGRAPFVGVDRHLDRAAVRRVLHGVREQVGEKLLQPRLVPHAPERRGRAHLEPVPVARRADLLDDRADDRDQIGPGPLERQPAGLEPREVEQQLEQLDGAVGLPGDRVKPRLDLLGRRRPGREPAPQQLRPQLDRRGRGLQVVGDDREDLVLEPLDLAPAGHVPEDDHTAGRPPRGVAQRRAAVAQDASPLVAQLGFDVAQRLPLAQRRDGRPQRGRDRACPDRPALPLPAVERLAEHDAVVAERQQVARGAVDPDDPPLGVEDQQRVGHALEDHLELGHLPLEPRLEVLRAAQARDRAGGLTGQRLERGQVVLVVRLGPVALDEQDADDLVVALEWHRESRLGQATAVGGVADPDRRSIVRPAPDELRPAGPDRLAGEAASERERSAGPLDAGDHLADDLDRRAGRVVQAEDEDGRVEQARRLPVERPAQPVEAPGAGDGLARGAERGQARPQPFDLGRRVGGGRSRRR
jgi:hypothetical protein